MVARLSSPSSVSKRVDCVEPNCLAVMINAKKGTQLVGCGDGRNRIVRD
jgi:hypothetical protein